MKQGFNILTGGTDNHLMLIDLRGMEVTGKELQNRCDEVYLTLNKNAVPNDPRSPFRDLRRSCRNSGRNFQRIKGRGYGKRSQNASGWLRLILRTRPTTSELK